MNVNIRRAIGTAILVLGLAIPFQVAPLSSPAYADPPAANTAPVLNLPSEEQRPEQGKPYAFKLDITDDSTALKDLKVEADAYIDVYTTFDGTHWYLHVYTTDITDLIRVTVRVTDAQGLTTAKQLKIWVKAEKPYFHPTVDRYFRVNKEIAKILVHPIDGLPTDVVSVEGLPPGLTWDPASANPRRPSQTYITGTPNTPGEYTVVEKLKRSEGGKEVEVASLAFKIKILTADAPRIAGDFTLPVLKAKKGETFTNVFRIQHKHGEFPYSTIKFEVDDPKLSTKRAHDNWEITLNTDEVFGPKRVKVTMVDPDGVRTEKFTTAEVVDPAINAAPVLKLPTKTQYPKQGQPYRMRLNVTDDFTPRKALKVVVESIHKVKAEFDGQHWYLVVDTTNYSDVERVLVTVTDAAGLSTTGSFGVWITSAKTWLHPTVNRTFRLNKAIEPILVRAMDAQPGDYVTVSGLPPGLTYDPNHRPHRDKSRTYITGTPTQVGTFPVVERVFNADGIEQNHLNFTITVLAPDAPAIHGDFVLPVLRANKGDIWRNRFDIIHKHGEHPYSTIKFEVHDPFLTTRRSHDQWMITLDTKEALGPVPVRVTLVEPDGYRADRWTIAEVVDPAVSKRKLTGVKDAYRFTRNQPITPIVIGVDDPKDGDVITVDGLPPELVYDAQTRTISGNPTVAGGAEMVVALKDKDGIAQDAKVVPLDVQPQAAPPPPGGPDPKPQPQPQPSPPVAPATTLEGLRINGASRVETAVAISTKTNGPASLDTAVLARADVFADAVAATPLAHQAKASLYLTQPDTLHQATANELVRVLKPNGTILIMGGEAAINPAVVDAITKAMPKVRVERVAGLNRFATAAAIHTKLGRPGTIALVRGDTSGVADGLVAGVAMARVTQEGNAAPGAVLFTDKGKLAPETKPVVEAATVTKVYDFGTGAQTSAPLTPIAGDDALGRSISAATTFYGSRVRTVAIAASTDTNVVDALAGGVDAARQGVPLVLAPARTGDQRTRTYLASLITAKQLNGVRLYGGTAAISQMTADALFEKPVTITWEVHER